MRGVNVLFVLRLMWKGLMSGTMVHGQCGGGQFVTLYLFLFVFKGSTVPLQTVLCYRFGFVHAMISVMLDTMLQYFVTM